MIVSTKSSENPGMCQVIKKTANTSLVKWPQIASEKVDVNLDYTYGETRTTPVRFVISMHLNQTERVVTTPNLTTSGRYSGFASSFFPGVKPGTYNLRIIVHVFALPENRDELHMLVKIP